MTFISTIFFKNSVQMLKITQPNLYPVIANMKFAKLKDLNETGLKVMSKGLF